jgi:hypothetical protein
MRARAFFYVCGGIFLLALSYHLGARTATAQAPGNPVVGIGGWTDGGGNMQPIAVTTNGDVYRSLNSGAAWQHISNVFSAGPVPASRESFGGLKSRYRGAPGGAQATTQDR